MALNKRNYVDNSTVITAENLNDIQDELIITEDNLNGIQGNLTSVMENVGYIGETAYSVGTLVTTSAYKIVGLINAKYLGNKNVRIYGDITFVTVNYSNINPNNFTIIPSTQLIQLAQKVNNSITAISTDKICGTWDYVKGNGFSVDNKVAYSAAAYINNTGLQLGRIYTESGAIGAWSESAFVPSTNGESITINVDFTVKFR